MPIYEINDLHIEDFNKDIARALIFLYDYFPRKLELYIEDIHGPDEIDDYGLHSQRHLACMSAIIWLAEENMIRYDSLVKQESFSEVVLTKKSYILLNQVIEQDDELKLSLETSTNTDKQANISNQALPASVYKTLHSRIALIKQALKSKSSEALKTMIYRFIHDSEYNV